jgi:hypothetical protein
MVTKYDDLLRRVSDNEEEFSNTTTIRNDYNNLWSIPAMFVKHLGMVGLYTLHPGLPQLESATLVSTLEAAEVLCEDPVSTFALKCNVCRLQRGRVVGLCTLNQVDP